MDATLARELGFDAEYVESAPLVDRPGVRFASQARILFPALTEVDTASAWKGLFAMAPDGLPGNGMTFGFLAAPLLLESWHGVKSAHHRLFAFDRMVRR